MGVAGAIIGGSVLSAGATMIGASSAADAQKSAADQANQTQRDMYAQNTARLAPFVNIGTTAAGNAAKDFSVVFKWLSEQTR